MRKIFCCYNIVKKLSPLRLTKHLLKKLCKKYLQWQPMNAHVCEYSNQNYNNCNN